MQNYHYRYESPLGTLLLIADEQCLLEIRMLPDDSLSEISMVDSACVPPLKITCKWLDDYFAGAVPSIDGLPLFYSGTAFQNRVWQLLTEIPYGQTVSYGQIAAKIAKERGISRMSAQAVGQAVGANPISIIIPCHRVIGSNGNLTGYAGGIDKKIWLLHHEKAI